MSVETVTVSRDHLLSHLAGATACGLDIGRVLTAVGVDPAVLDDPLGQVSYQQLSEIRLEVCRVLDDENAGFHDKPARWGSTVYFCRAIASSRTLREALYRYERFAKILDDEMAVRVVERHADTAVEFRFVNRKAIDLRAHAENKLYFLFSFCLWLTARRFLPRMIGFDFAEPGFAADYPRFVPCPYRFGDDANRLVIDNALLREPVRRSPRLLNQFLASHLSHLITEAPCPAAVADKVRRLIDAGLAASPDLDVVSATLNIPPTTLRRRLKIEGRSFQEIKDEVRRTRAIHYLVDKRLSVSETAELTGFSDPAAFSRAFKSWTGRSPSEFARPDG